MYRTFLIAAVVLLLVDITACKSNNQQAETSAQNEPVVVQSDTASTAAAQSIPGQSGIKGTVAETMDAAGYTYVKLDTADGPLWAAMPQSQVEVGQEITLSGGMEMQNFEAKTLGRTFDSIIFSGGIVKEQDGSAGPSGAAMSNRAALPPGHESFADAMKNEASMETVQPMNETGGSEAAMAPAEEVIVEKAEGENAFTIVELHEKNKELDKQDVVVRGKVVKVSPMIMGKNWIHLQDGTGDPAVKTHDLVVTTPTAQPEVGSVIIVEGKVSADRDFGAGYKYDVIIEDAEVK